ncbi:MAG: 4Fe-4S dicluster domain-containing protein [Sedimentisphaerales bacterium]|nr:4Fe-4S dicluster domain-containing protein [Sedimentisphaerales bacterium]
MQTVFVNDLEPFLSAVVGQMDVYYPRKIDSHYVFEKYNSSSNRKLEINNIRACTPAKEFLFPLRELAAVFPEPLEPRDIRPFAVFGLKDCDLRSIEVLDKVFTEKDFEDPFYIERREKMFIITTDCSEPAASCFCNVMGGGPFARDGFDLNISQVETGFIIEAGSKKGDEFLAKHSQLFSEAGNDVLSERQKNRETAQKQLEENNAELKFDAPVQEIVEKSYDSDVYDEEAATCVECQACTRVCPTCHCFYLYDTKQKDYFGKMKMWDSCMRLAYAQVAGGENPRKVLGDRLRHRFMHKFSFFLDRYGINMCVGCGRCVDAESGEVDIREVLKKLSQELLGKGGKKAEVAQ